MVTIHDVSEKSGYAVSTVSKALNGYKDISEKARQHILNVAQELGYSANYYARALKTKKTYNIGLLYFDNTHNGLKNEFFSWLIDSFRAAAEDKGYDITLVNTKIGPDKKSYLDHALYRGFDGVVLICEDSTNPEVIELATTKKFPVVSIDMIFDRATLVKSNNYSGMTKLTEYIISQGHKRIALISGHDSWVTKDRIKGFEDTIRVNSDKIEKTWIQKGYYRDLECTEKNVRELLQQEIKPTCIIVPDDLTVLGAIRAIEESGLNYPNDVSVAGYDGIQISQVISPAFTTIRQDSEMMGRIAADKLIEAIENGRNDFEQEIVTVEGHLVKGESVVKLEEK